MSIINSDTMQIMVKPCMRGQKREKLLSVKGFNKGDKEYMAFEKVFDFDHGEDNTFLRVSS